jgi:branched-chain amino acid transport system ATP-binding protein
MPTSATDSAERPPVALDIDTVVAGYGGPPIIRGVCAQVGAGEIVTVVGPNGAGKSTMLKAVAGLLRVQRGSVRLDGKEIANVRTHQLARLGLGYVPQNNDVFDPLTVQENLEMGGYLMRRHDIKERIEEVVTILPALNGLMKRRAVKLSGGERKMVAVGRALMSRPRVLLLDEPSMGLAPMIVAQIFRILRDIRAAGASLLLVEQNAAQALALADRAYVLETGEIVMSGPASDLLADDRVRDAYLGTGAT